jgi:hypothetical protein
MNPVDAIGVGGARASLGDDNVVISLSTGEVSSAHIVPGITRAVEGG